MHESVCRQDSFHGFLVGNSAYQREIGQMCKQHERVGLPMPNETTQQMCLHTVAVQATGELEQILSALGQMQSSMSGLEQRMSQVLLLLLSIERLHDRSCRWRTRWRVTPIS